MKGSSPWQQFVSCSPPADLPCHDLVPLKPDDDDDGDNHHGDNHHGDNHDDDNDDNHDGEGYGDDDNNNDNNDDDYDLTMTLLVAHRLLDYTPEV